MINVTENVESKDAVNEHDEEDKGEHVQNGRKTLQNLSNESPDSSAKVIVNQENGPQRSCDAEVIFAIGKGFR